MREMLIKNIKLNKRAQPREKGELEDKLVDEYAEAMKAGAKFPPVIAFGKTTEAWLGDGWHRIAAAQKAGLKKIPVDLRPGELRDAVLHSVGCNAAHGLRRTNKDKQRAIKTLLEDDEWCKWSDREIARRCCVDHVTVSRVRKELSGENHQIEKQAPEQPRTFTRGGTTATMNTAKIGRQPDLYQQTEEQPVQPVQPEKEDILDKCIREKKLDRRHWKQFPKSLLHVFGMLEKAQEALETWKPGKLKECPKCLGAGHIATPGNEKVTVKCDFCIGGKAGDIVYDDALDHRVNGQFVEYYYLEVLVGKTRI